jgi:hypothetical protein
VRLGASQEQRHEHRRVGPAVDIERGRLARVEEDLLQAVAQVVALSARG